MARSPKKQLVNFNEMSQAFGSMFSDVGQAINPFGNSSNKASDTAASQVNPMNNPNVYGSQAYRDKKFFEKHGMTREEKMQKENEKTLREQTIENNKKKAEEEAKKEKDKIRKDAGLLSQEEALDKLNNMLNPSSAPFTITRNIRRSSARRNRR